MTGPTAGPADLGPLVGLGALLALLAAIGGAAAVARQRHR
jgi:hypothetical protein